jgi:Transglutaminase-like superfamily
MKATVAYILAFVFIASLTGCSSSASLFHSANGLTYPRLVEAEFSISIDSVQLYDRDSLRASNERKGIPSGQPPTLLIWSSNVIDRPGQQVMECDFLNVLPTEIVTEHENGNEICFWDLSGKLAGPMPLVIRKRFSYTTYDYAPTIGEPAFKSSSEDIPDELFYFYTKSEPFLEQTPEIIALASSIVKDETSIMGKAKSIFTFVRSKMRYKYPPDARGVLDAIKSYEGDCGQYSALFIALCRCAGVPARQQSGFAIDSAGFGYHVWSEIFVPEAGWVPMDATLPEGFAHIPNNRYIASVGMNLPLKHVPLWASYADQDAQGNRTDFMQFATMVTSGFKAKITTERKLLRSEDLR